MPRCLAALFFILLLPAQAAPPPRPPSEVFGALYRDVQMAEIFDDQKSFADAIPQGPPDEVLAAYDREKGRPAFSLKTFVTRHFIWPARNDVAPAPPRGGNVAAYIAATWSLLVRPPDKDEPHASLLPLSRPYVVPGGRFSEIYYWDSYFTMLGLEQGGRHGLARDMLANFADLIDRYGHVPNGNRSYYLSRSQPPFFAAMVELAGGPGGLEKYRPQLEAEYAYWMDGAGRLAPGGAWRHVVRLKDGTILNRYWDDRAAPRDESYRQDVLTARQSNRPAAQVYRDLRAGAESGWDFSSRWLDGGARLAAIRTTDYAPIDLNCLLLHLEDVLARVHARTGDTAGARAYRAKAAARRAAIRRLMWNGDAGLFTDYLWREERQSDVLTAASVFALYFDAATRDQARAMAAALRSRFLRPGGLATTLNKTGEQWDAPNGWAPLQYLAVAGLREQGQTALAREIAQRWLRRVSRSYRDTGVLAEKYDIAGGPPAIGAGGEYRPQLGFGWTNGVTAKLLAEYPGAGR